MVNISLYWNKKQKIDFSVAWLEDVVARQIPPRTRFAAPFVKGGDMKAAFMQQEWGGSIN